MESLQTTYVVTATNSFGSGTATVILAVGGEKPTISYQTPQTYAVNTTIAPLHPNSTGGAMTAQVSTLAGNNAIDGVGTAASFYNPIGVATDALGNVYVADSYNHKIRKITPTGEVSTLAGLGTPGSTDGLGTAASFNDPRGVATDALGNIYVADTFNNKIRKITSGGVVTTLAGSGTSGFADGTGIAASFNAPFDVATDASGNVYVSDYNNNTVRKITPTGVVTTLAGSRTAGSADGIGTAASFNYPGGVATDTSGNVYVADQFNNKIRKITPAGVVSTLAGSGAIGSVDGVGTAARFDNPMGVVTDSLGNVFVADLANRKIRKITPAGVVSTLAGSGAFGFEDGTGTVANFKAPMGVATDSSGNVYVADMENNNIRKITPTGVVSTLAGKNGIDGTGTAASFYTPSGVTTDNSGNVYVADRNNFRIRKIIPTGEVTTFAGSGIPGSEDGTGPAASFSSPAGVATDTSGNVYVADNYKIRKITPAGVVSTLAGSEISGFADGIGTAASFGGSMGIATDTLGNVYVADGYNNRIRKMTPTGMVTTLAGSGTQGSADGIGTAASFYNSSGVATDASGNVYVAGAYNNNIRKITAAGVVTTLAGSGTLGSADGTGIVASFNYPVGIATDASGNVYVADIRNRKIRKITAAGEVSTLAGSGTLGSADGTGAIARFNTPIGIATDTSGNVYVTDSGNNNIRKITPAGGYTISPQLPTGLTIDNSTGEISGTPTVISPQTTYTITATNSYGTSTTTVVLAVEGEKPVISYPTPQTYTVGTTIGPLQPKSTGLAISTQVSTLAGNGQSSWNDGIGTAAGFNVPRDVAVDAQGNVYVAEMENHRIRKITPAGVVTTFAGYGKPGFADGTGRDAFFNSPQGVAVDSSGNVYVADTYNNKIRKISPDGVVTTLAGSGTSGSNDGIGTTASFNWPGGVAVDAQGNVYVADSRNQKIRKISLDGVVSTFAGSGAIGSADGVGTLASFGYTQDIALDSSGNMYVADGKGSNRIRKITSAGVVSTLAGSGEYGSVDGSGTSASFSTPIGIAVDNQGNIYVADTYNNKIRKISPAGTVSTLAGSGTSGASDGTGISASFYEPFGVAVDSQGNVYVADSENHMIRKITQAGSYSVSPQLPVGLTIDLETGIISGTPTVISPQTTYTVTATNNYGTGTATVVITVGAKPAITYSTPQIYTNGVAITPLMPTITGSAVDIYSISPSLPKGLSFDNATGAISGTPTVISAQTTYTVTAKNAYGPGTATIVITVGEKPVVNYNTPQTYIIGVDITSLLPINTGSVVDSYSISPNLPKGISFNAKTGEISGKPAVVSPQTIYTVKATNAYGEGTTTLSIVVDRILSSNNFTVTSKGESCIGENNGEISIVATQSLDYVATINGTKYNFVNNSLKVSSLVPGTYNVAVTIPGETFEQNFTITIPKGATITGKSSIASNKVSVEIAEGTAPYTVFVDGVKQFETTDSSFSVDTKKGGMIEVKTAKACEGVYTEDIAGIAGAVTAYPNPTSGNFVIELPTTKEKVVIALYALNGTLISNKSYTVENGKVQLTLENQAAGVYIAKVDLGTPVNLRIIKK
jgi:streptogramin lyase